MGYFNYFVKCIIRKFVNFIFNRENFFKFCCILFLVLVITKLFLQTPISYGATTTISDTTYYDGYTANVDLLNSLQTDFISRCFATSDTAYLNSIVDLLTDGSLSVCFYYGDVSGSNHIGSLPFNKRYLQVIFVPYDNISRTTTYLNWNNNGEVVCSTFTCDTYYNIFTFDNNSIQNFVVGPNQFTHNYPSYLFNYKSDVLIEFLNNYLDKSSDDLQGIIQESTNTIVESEQQTQNTIKEQTNTIKEQTDFLTSNTISDDSFALPEDDTNDTTGVDDEINFIFDDIMNTFTDTSSNNSIELTFPFTNQGFEISYSSIYNGVFEKNDSLAYLKSIIQLCYWYGISVFVFKDISDKVNKIKTGDVDKIQTGNIKEDLL